MQLFIQLSHKTEKVIIWSYNIEHFFVTFGTPMSDHISFIFAVVNTYWSHQSMTSWLAVSRRDIIHMERIETYWTVIACWSCGMESDFSSTILTREWLISHRESHILWLYYISSSIIIGQWSDPIWDGRYSILRFFANILSSPQNASIRHPTLRSRLRVTGSHHE